MKKSVIVAFAGITAFLLFGVFFGFGKTGLAVFYSHKDGNKVNYNVKDVGAFIQCIDGEPKNDIFNKGSCITQVHIGNEIKGINSMDFCKNENEVVDYYCSSSMTCVEAVNNCPEDYICSDGKCIEDFKPFRYFDIRKLGERFNGFFR